MNSRGIVLLNVIIMLLVMVFVAGAMIQMSLGRTANVARHRTSVDTRAVAQSVRVMIEACLNGAAWSASPPSCSTGGIPFSGWTSATCSDGLGTSCSGVQTTLTMSPVATSISGGMGLNYKFTACWCPPTGATQDSPLIITCVPGPAPSGC
jgi:hypothetical protein